MSWRDTERKHDVTNGYAALPQMWYLDAVPDGDADPFQQMPSGTLYSYLPGGGANNLFVKTGEAAEDYDWSVFAPKVVRIALSAASDTNENDTGWDLPSNAVVLDVYLRITTAEATASTKTIDIGTDGSGSNDPDGFADALSTATLGLVRPGVTVTAGGTETYYSANTRGVLLSTFLAGADSAADTGHYTELPDTTSGGESVTWTAGEAQTEFAGFLYVVYFDLY